MGKFGPRIQIFLDKVKFGTQSNLNVQNAMIMFIFDR